MSTSEKSTCYYNNFIVSAKTDITKVSEDSACIKNPIECQMPLEAKETDSYLINLDNSRYNPDNIFYNINL